MGQIHHSSAPRYCVNVWSADNQSRLGWSWVKNYSLKCKMPGEGTPCFFIMKQLNSDSAGDWWWEHCSHWHMQNLFPRVGGWLWKSLFFIYIGKWDNLPPAASSGTWRVVTECHWLFSWKVNTHKLWELSFIRVRETKTKKFPSFKKNLFGKRIRNTLLTSCLRNVHR